MTTGIVSLLARLHSPTLKGKRKRSWRLLENTPNLTHWKFKRLVAAEVWHFSYKTSTQSGRTTKTPADHCVLKDCRAGNLQIIRALKCKVCRQTHAYAPAKRLKSRASHINSSSISQLCVLGQKWWRW